jgi:hypothetical protein
LKIAARRPTGLTEGKTAVSDQRRNQRESNRRGRVASRQFFGADQQDYSGEARSTSRRGQGRSAQRGDGVIVIDPNFDRLLFLLTAAFFALAVARTAYLLFG